MLYYSPNFFSLVSMEVTMSDNSTVVKVFTHCVEAIRRGTSTPTVRADKTRNTTFRIG